MGVNSQSCLFLSLQTNHSALAVTPVALHNRLGRELVLAEWLSKVKEQTRKKRPERDFLLTCFLLLSSQIKPIVSSYLKEKNLPYQEDRYLSRLRMFFHRYQELMVFAPPITKLVGVQ